jgi:preprotein translocase subunit YajC
MEILAAQQSSNPLGLFLPLILIGVVFYFFLIRPQSKRRREQMQVQNSVRPGARVMTTNGMYATVTEVDDDGIVLEIAPGVEARFVKQAIMQVVDDNTGDDTDEDLDDEELEDQEFDDELEDETADETSDKTKTVGADDDQPKAGEKSSTKPSS